MHQPTPKLVPAAESDITILRNLYQLYLHDLSEFSDNLQPDASGLFDPSDVDLFFEEEALIPLKILVSGEIAGFVFLSKSGGSRVDYVIQETFILRGHRGKGLGKAVLKTLVEISPGKYGMYVLKDNVPAEAFWRGALTSLGIEVISEDAELHGDACTALYFATL